MKLILLLLASATLFADSGGVPSFFRPNLEQFISKPPSTTIYIHSTFKWNTNYTKLILNHDGTYAAISADNLESVCNGTHVRAAGMVKGGARWIYVKGQTTWCAPSEHSDQFEILFRGLAMGTAERVMGLGIPNVNFNSLVFSNASIHTRAATLDWKTGEAIVRRKVATPDPDGEKINYRCSIEFGKIQTVPAWFPTKIVTRFPGGTWIEDEVMKIERHSLTDTSPKGAIPNEDLRSVQDFVRGEKINRQKNEDTKSSTRYKYYVTIALSLILLIGNKTKQTESKMQ